MSSPFPKTLAPLLCCFAALLWIVLEPAAELPPLEANSLPAPNMHLPAGFSWCGGVELRGRKAGMGGISDMVLQHNQLLAITDQGKAFRMEVGFDDTGWLRTATSIQALPLHDAQNHPFTGRWNDAEAIAQTPDGAIWIGFEREHRLQRFRFSDMAWVADGKPVLLPMERHGKHSNLGVEALDFHDGQLHAIAEAWPETGSHTALWQVSPETQNITTGKPFSISDGFMPTSLRFTSAGKAIVLERSFTLQHGFQSRLRFPATDKTIQLSEAIGHENAEAIAIAPLHDGRIRLLIASDDNFHLWQKTRLIALCLSPKWLE